ncbi:MAG: DNA-3-methyladenine glycosylase I [Desulfobacterales bacterium]
MRRCEWANGSVLEQKYHDNEWGRPVHDDRLLFEFLILEGAQAGLSWLTILKKREGYRKAFDNFQANKIARYSEEKIANLLSNPEIVRNKLKVNAAVLNARVYLDIQDEFGSFDNYIWKFVGGQTIQNSWRKPSEIPTNSTESDIMSKDLKRRGFKFIGTTICYAFMQAVGLVNDHTVDCYVYNQIKKETTL